MKLYINPAQMPSNIVEMLEQTFGKVEIRVSSTGVIELPTVAALDAGLTAAVKTNIQAKLSALPQNVATL